MNQLKQMTMICRISKNLRKMIVKANIMMTNQSRDLSSSD